MVALTRQRLFRLWKAQSSRPLNKIKAVRFLNNIGIKRKAKKLLIIWQSLARHEAELEERMMAFRCYKQDRDLEICFKHFAKRVFEKVYKRKKL